MITAQLVLVVTVWIRSSAVLGRMGYWKKGFDGVWSDRRAVLGDGDDRQPISLPISIQDSR